MSLPAQRKEELLRQKTVSSKDQSKWKEIFLYIDSEIKYRVIAYPLVLWELMKDVGSWIWDQIKRVGKARKVFIAYGNSMWTGSIFPLKVTITDQGETYVMRSVTVGRSLALATVSLLYSWKIGFVENKGYVPFIIVFVIYLVSKSSLVWDALKLSFIVFQLGFLGLGVWRAKEFVGLKSILTGKLNRASKISEKQEEQL